MPVRMYPEFKHTRYTDKEFKIFYGDTELSSFFMHYFLVTGKRLACAGLAQREVWLTDLCFLKIQLRELRALPSFSRNSLVLIEEKQPSN